MCSKPPDLRHSIGALFGVAHDLQSEVIHGGNRGVPEKSLCSREQRVVHWQFALLLAAGCLSCKPVERAPGDVIRLSILTVALGDFLPPRLIVVFADARTQSTLKHPFMIGENAIKNLQHDVSRVYLVLTRQRIGRIWGPLVDGDSVAAIVRGAEADDAAAG